MANYISKITVPVTVDGVVQNTTFEIKDAEARQLIENLGDACYWIGVTTTELTDGSTTNPISVGGEDVTAKVGGMAQYSGEEFIWNGSAWQSIGKNNFGKLAFQSSASGDYTPAGTVSQPTFTGTQGNVSVSGTPAGTISVGVGEANYTPDGSVSEVGLNTTTVNSITDVGTLPTFSISGETLTFTPGTLPTKGENTTVATGISAQPEFTGTGVTLLFTGASTESTGTFTPDGTVSQPTFSGTETEITVQ